MAVKRMRAWRLLRLAGLLFFGAVLTAGARSGSALAQSQLAAKPTELGPVSVPLPPASAPIEGFRDARFGMSEPEVRQAIRRDFPAAADRLSRFTHPRERTTVLALTATELLPDTGPAQVSYILGYTSKRLVQVNIVWSTDGHSAARDEAIVAAANLLRDHFEAQYPAPSNAVVANQPAGGNTFLVFRTNQPGGRSVILLLNGAASAGRAGRSLETPPLRLQLSYIADRRNPDIFRIEPGRF